MSGSFVCLPNDVDMSVLGGQVERRRPVGVGGVSFFRLQQSGAHVTGQEQLHHLITGTQGGGGEHVSTCLNPAHLRFFLSEG